MPNRAEPAAGLWYIGDAVGSLMPGLHCRVMLSPQRRLVALRLGRIEGHFDATGLDDLIAELTHVRSHMNT